VRTIEGTLCFYTEQGWEAYFELWICQEGEPRGEALAPGDRLTVWDPEGGVVFDQALPDWHPRWVWWVFLREPRLPLGFWDWFHAGWRARAVLAR